MRSQDASARGAQAPGEPTAAVLALWAGAQLGPLEPAPNSLSRPVRRILRAISQESDFSAGRRQQVPGGSEPIVLNLRTKSTLFTAAIAATVLGIALLLVYQLVSVSDDPDLTRQIGWNLLFIGLSAGILAAGAAWWVVRRVNLPLRRLAETMSAMARAGQLRSDFRAAGGGSEVRLIEETFRALTISLEESQRARERSYVEAVGAVVTAADARDHETTGHSFRVSLYAVALAKALGIHGEELKAIEWGSLLHDVGKMVVPDEILRKMGPLTAEEWHIMKQHATWGFDMLAEVSFLQPAALDIIYSHHERWDGKGYPRGIAKGEIPLAARIFAVVDTYDAITSDRPYRRARSYQVAVNELQRVAGQQLDPLIVEAFAELSEVELRRLRELCKHVHPGLSLPADLLDSLAEPEPERRAEA
jgi:putative nucleotidyltransferase with HDIG domain